MRHHNNPYFHWLVTKKEQYIDDNEDSAGTQPIPIEQMINSGMITVSVDSHTAVELDPESEMDLENQFWPNHSRMHGYYDYVHSLQFKIMDYYTKTEDKWLIIFTTNIRGGVNAVLDLMRKNLLMIRFFKFDEEKFYDAFENDSVDKTDCNSEIEWCWE